MNILIGLLVAVVSLVVALAYVAFFGKKPDYKFGGSEPDVTLGEYGLLRAELEDLENPYSGRAVIDGPPSIIALAVVGAVSVFTYWSVEKVYGSATGMAAGFVVLLALSIIASSLITKLRKMHVLRQIKRWRNIHPNVDVDA